MAKRNGKVTNEVLLEKINSIIERIERIQVKTHDQDEILTKQGNKLVKLETKQSVMWGVSGALGSAIIAIAINIING